MAKQVMRTVLIGATALTTMCLSNVPMKAHAQDISGLTGRLERIERDLMVLQRQIYRVQADGENQSAVPQASAGTPASTVVKLGELEEQIRDLTGQVETTLFQIQQNKARMDRLNADIDFRLQRLEGGAPVITAPVNGEAANNAGTSLQAPTTTMPQLVAPPPQGAIPVAPSSDKITLTPPPSATSPVTSPVAPTVMPTVSIQQSPAKTNTLQIPSASTGNPRKDYDNAFRFMQKGNYAAAEGAFLSFLATHKDHALAGNAKYWLGETYYVRGQYDKAAVTFADGYKSYRNSPKAPDSLLKLGFSMRKLGKAPQSCAAYGQLLKEYPKSSKVIVQLAQSARKELKCP